MTKHKFVYHIGLAIRDKTLVIEARRDIDYLSCELYDYLGIREITKQKIKENRYLILEWAKDTDRMYTVI